MKQLHWTQTEEGRAKLSKSIKKALRKKRKMNAIISTPTQPDSNNPIYHTFDNEKKDQESRARNSIALADLKAPLGDYADRTGLPRAIVTKWMAEILHTTEMWQGVGIVKHM